MSEYKEARDAGCEYLLRQRHEDGSFGDGTVGDYYKVPAAFQVCGETNAANRLCDWIRKNGMGADGDFGPRTDFTSGYFYAYFNIWVILGAQRLGQFDLVQRGMDFLMDFYDEGERRLLFESHRENFDDQAGSLGREWLRAGRPLCEQARRCERCGKMDAADDGRAAALP